MIRGSMPELFGFKTSKRSVHSARSMMGKELDRLFEETDSSSIPATYQEAIVHQNVLSKDTANNRVITFQMLRTLYTLDPCTALFRALRRLRTARPEIDHLLYFQLAYARDPLLRAATPIVLGMALGEKFEKAPIEVVVREFPYSSYSPVSIASFTRNMSSTWTQAGFLEGKATKRRVQPKIAPVHVVFACLCAYLDGWQGEMIFESPWVRLLDRSMSDLEVLIDGAVRLGQLRLLKAGGVYEFRFPGYLTPEEEAYLYG